VNEALINSHGIDLIALCEETSRVYIWKAVQRTLDRTVHLVILKEEPSASAQETACFLQIARQFAKIKCESLASIFDIVSDGSLHYVIMDYVEGLSLDELVKKEGPLPFNRVMLVGTAVAGTLKQLWNSSKIIHRNLKGSTVRFDERGIAKLTDFSLAVIDSPDFDPEVIDKGHVLGSPPFLSPEHARGDAPLSTQSDMYSLGALLYYIATGKAPFADRGAEAILAAHLTDSIPPPHRLIKGIPVHFSRLLYRLMVKEPAWRYRNWEEVHHDLHCIMDGREPVCANLDLSHLSTIEADFSQALFTEASEPIAIRIKSRKRSEYLAGIQDKHVSHHHEVDARSTLQRQRMVMWLILSLWLAGLFWFRAIFQVNPEQQQALRDRGQSIGTIFEDLLPPRRPDAVIAAEMTEDAGEQAPAELAENPIPSALATTLAQALKNGDAAAAVAALESSEADFAGRSAMLRTLKNLPASEALVSAHIAGNINRPMVLNFKGTPRKVIPRSIDGTMVRLEANERSTDFNIANLSPEQKVNWMDTPRSVEEHVVFCMLLLQTPRAAEAARYAAGCGALAPVIERAVGL
jgi:serine/threonine protein kinase